MSISATASARLGGDDTIPPVNTSPHQKLVIFTEHRDSLNYLDNNIATLLGRTDAVVTIHGGMSREARVEDASVSPLPATFPDRLFLVAASGVPQFRPVFDALSRIEVYNLNPREIGAMQKPDPGDRLTPSPAQFWNPTGTASDRRDGNGRPGG